MRIRGHIVRDYPALANDPTLRDRLNAAFTQTKMLRFTHDGPIVDFLYAEATTPGFYWIPEVMAWLHKPGVRQEKSNTRTKTKKSPALQKGNPGVSEFLCARRLNISGVAGDQFHSSCWVV
ncbi:hypothetical protein [Paraburkholderia sp. EG304]|uniref:hypothetical protein n=1 Tax=Paraburkholderia sp. EG304 TaxID=3237015 RepID=UPI00397C340E